MTRMIYNNGRAGNDSELIYSCISAFVILSIILLSMPQGAYAVEIEKRVYDLDEQILIRTTPNAQSITIHCGNDHYRYLDEIPPTIAYRSNKESSCTITESVADTETSVQFRVMNLSQLHSAELAWQQAQQNNDADRLQISQQQAPQSYDMLFMPTTRLVVDDPYYTRDMWNLVMRNVSDVQNDFSILAEGVLISGRYNNTGSNYSNNQTSQESTDSQNQSYLGIGAPTDVELLIASMSSNQKSIKNNQKILENDEIPLQHINKNIRIKTSRGTGWDADVIIKSNGKRFAAKTADLGPTIPKKDEMQDLPDIDVFFKERHIKSISLKKAILNDSIDIGVDELDPSAIDSPDKVRWTNVYAFDPQSLDFSDGTLSAVAEGTELYKCKDWNFTTRTCLGSWVKVMDLQPGQEYSLALSPVDPGFAESVPNIGIESTTSQSNLKITGAIPTTFGNSAADKWIITVINPTNNTVNVTRVQFISSGTIFGTITGLKPATTWTSTTSVVNWTGLVTIAPMNSTEFIVRIADRNTAILNAYVTLNATTTAGTLTTDGYITHCNNGNIPFPTLTLISNGAETTTIDNIAQDAATSYMVRVNNSGGGAAIPIGNTLMIMIPPGWTNVTANVQTGWLLGTTEGNQGSGWILMPQVASTTIAAGAHRNFTFSAIPPQETNTSIHTFTTRFFGPEGAATTRTLMSTLEPSIRVINATPLLSENDSRYQEISSIGGSRSIEQYVSIPAPMEYGGNPNYMGVTIVNPTNDPISVTQIDFTADANLFGAITGRRPASTWTRPNGAQIRWTGTVTVPPRSSEEFIFTLVANGTSNTLGTITITSTTNVSTLTTSGWRSSYTSTANTPFPSIYTLNATALPTFKFENITSRSNKTFVVRINNSGASAVIPLNTLLEITLPPGWSNITIPTQTGWTTRRITEDSVAGSKIRIFVTGTTIATNAVRDFTFSARAPSVGANSTYRIDMILMGPTGQLNSQSIRTVTQFAANVVPNGSLTGINENHTSENISDMPSVAILKARAIAKASNTTVFTLSIYNRETDSFDEIRSASLGTVDEEWNITYTLNKTFNPQKYIENNTAAATFGKTIIRWNSSSYQSYSILENLLEINATYDITPPQVSLESPQNDSYTNISNVFFYYNSTDEYGIENCTIYLNSSLRISNSSPTNGTNQFNNTLADGKYNWSVGCFDLVGLYNQTQNWTLTVDTINPTIRIVSPQNNSKFNHLDLTFNYTPTDLNIANCSIYLDDLLQYTNTTVASGQESQFVITTVPGSHNWSIECFDLAGNNYKNHTLFFTIDNDAPIASNIISYPASNSIYNQSQSYMFNVTWTDPSGIDTVIFESNFSGVAANNTVTTHNINEYYHSVSTISAGPHYWRMYANDTYGNWQATNIQPYIVLKAESNITLYLNETIENYAVEANEPINITAILSTPSQGFIEIYQNGTLIASGNDFVQTIQSYATNGSRNITAIYPATQNYSSSYMTLLVVVGDRNGPRATPQFPVNNTHTNLENISFIFYITDETGTDTCRLYINNTLNKTVSGIQNNENTTINVSGFNEGNYSFKLWCNDTLNNRVNTTIRYFAVDRTLPLPFSLISPANDTITKNQTPLLSWTQSNDTYFDNYTILIDNANDFSTPNYINLTAQYDNTSFMFPDILPSGIWFWRVLAFDKAGNYFDAGFFKYNIDLDPPIVILHTINGTYSNISDNIIRYTPTDTNNITNCTLLMNDSTSYHNLTILNAAENNFSFAKPQGEYLWNITCFDIAGNYYTSESNVFIIDLTSPSSIQLLSPANSTLSNNSTPQMNWTEAIEQNFANYTLLMSDNETFSYINRSYAITLITATSYNIPDPLNDANWFWKVLTCDKAGNCAESTSTYSYSLDNTAPLAFDLVLPANNTASTNNTPELSWSESYDQGFSNYTIVIDDNPSFASIDRIYAITNSSNTSIIVDPALGMNVIWYWKVIAWDGAQNSYETRTFQYITDNQAPIVSLVAPANNSLYKSETSSLITFTFNVTDLSDIDNCILSITGDESFDDVKYFISKNVNQSFVETLSTGNYNWSVNCTDAAQNIAQSSRFNLSVNVTLPKKRWYDNSRDNMPQINSSANWTAMSVYANDTGVATNSIPKYRLWNGSGWSPEYDLPDSGSPLRWVQLASSTLQGRSEEKIAVTVSDDGWLDAYVWNGSSWTAYNNLASIGTTSNAYRAFDIDYETQRGRAMLTYAINSTNASRDLAYRIWNGSGWSVEEYINDPSTTADSTIGYVRIAANPAPGSNELAIAFIDTTNSDGKAMIWNGSGWEKPVNITTALTINTEEDIAIAYEQQSKRILAVAGTGSTVAYALYNRSSWNQTGTVDINPNAATNTNWLTLKPNPVGDEIMVTGVDAGNDLSTALWSNGWSGQRRHDPTVDGNAQRPADFDWQRTGDLGILVWGTATGQLNYSTYSLLSSWSTQYTLVTGSNTHSWVLVKMNPNNNSGDVKDLILSQETTNIKLTSTRWTGSTPLLNDSLLTSSQNRLTYQSFDLIFNKFPPIVGTINNITLNISVDGTRNQISITGVNLSMISNATTPSMSNYSALGMLIPKGSNIKFNAELAVMNPGISYLTWAAYKVNSSGETLLCRKGNYTRDSSSTLLDSSFANYTAYCSMQNDSFLGLDDQIRIYLSTNSSAENTITKYVDSAGTYAEVDGFPLGILSVGLLSPTVDPHRGEGENISMICNASCSGGYCMMTQVNAEINSTPWPSPTYTPINYFTGAIILNNTATNPVILGSINSTINASFELLGNMYSANNSIRCSATSDYSNATSGEFNISIYDKTPPNITLISPPNLGAYDPGIFNFTYNASDPRLGLCSLWGNWSGTWKLNQTMIPNNGTYSTFENLNISNYGIFGWNVNCSDHAQNDGFAPTNFTLFVAGDMFVESSDITFSPSSPTEGANVTVFANIRNKAARNETDVKVAFYNASPLLGGVQIGQNITIPLLEGRKNYSVNQSIIVILGQTTVFVVVDPEFGSGEIIESDELNNMASNTVYVSIWQTYYGNTSGNTTLGTYSNITFVNWINENATGNIYISDTDTTNGINFVLLRPLGKNTTGNTNGLTTDDFVQADILLNTSSYPDNINNTFTYLGSPRMSEAFNLYGKAWSGVAVANSTQDGNFTTGILWDADDSTNSYYDDTDKEDLVFITKINQNTGSVYGVIDYAAKIPSKLKDLKGTTSTVTIYYELQ